MDICHILAADKNLLFYHWSAGELTFFVKSIVVCTNELNQKIALKLSKT